MNILHVIHGYPPHYMAGSEVYTWNLCRRLAEQHRVSVFSRIENPYAAAYEVSNSIDDGVRVRRINKPQRDYTFRDKYLDPKIDEVFRAMLRETRPDVVHFGHLSHLSSQLPIIARQEFGIPVVFTLHDFWLRCFRGQLIKPDKSICEGPSA
ncbi:glycosyltransferase, partial [Myxococcota bacterium]|nr:glycosyltransferase [Myxococcota bacterium]